MPEIAFQNLQEYDLFAWKITENITSLLQAVPIQIQKEALRYKNLTHRKQFIAKHILLNKYHLNDFLQYQSTGRPYMTNGKHISISHTGNYVVIVTSHLPVGVDIERPKKTLSRIQSRFLHPLDAVSHPAHPADLLWIWTAKESIYKLVNHPGLSFKKDIQVQQIDKNHFSGWAIVNNLKIQLTYKAFDANFLMCIAQYMQT